MFQTTKQIMTWIEGLKMDEVDQPTWDMDGNAATNMDFRQQQKG